MDHSHVISGLKEKRSAVAGQIIDLRQQADRLQADLFHIDSVLKLYGLDPDEIPAKGRMPKRTAYFARGEISRRCYNLLREQGTISADDVSVQAMLDKGMDPYADKKIRADFTRRVLVTLHDFRNAGRVEKIGDKRGVRWKLVD